MTLEELKKLAGVDTIRITLQEGSYTIKNMTGFRGSLTCQTKSATKTEKAMGLYLPRLTLSCPTGKWTLSVEFSMMKLLNGDNIQELTAGQACDGVTVLRTLLKEQGVEVTEEALFNANISRLDVGKNLLCPPGTTAPYILGLLKGALVSARKSQMDIDYMNGGAAMRTRTAGTDVIIYDKLRDKELGGISEKLSLDKDHYIQCAVVQAHLEKGLEILRFEKRFPRRQSVKRFFEPFGIKSPKLKHIFDPKISQSLVQAEWKQLRAGIVAFPTQNKSFKNAVMDLLQSDKDIKLKDLFANLGFQWLLKECSLVEIKRLFSGKKQKAALPYFQKRIKSFQSGVTPQAQAVFGDLDRQIQEWLPISLPDQAN